jgi:iron complex transport system ATP-binding protein
MLSAHEITVRVGRKTLLEGITIDVAPGRITALLGGNGAGKSTLLKVLSGEITPGSGRVRINGADLRHLPVESAARMRAVLAQDSVLSAEFTAMEVALLGRIPYIGGRPSELDRLIAHEALEAADARHLAARRYTTLSGGERQRVHLARVLAQVWEPADAPRYLLLDEPTSSLDPAHQRTALAAARDFARRGGGVLAILHDPNLACHFADHVILMKRGRVVTRGTPRDVFTPENIRAAFDIMALVVPHPCSPEMPLVIADFEAASVQAPEVLQ